jgi:hypothetical protein
MFDGEVLAADQVEPLGPGVVEGDLGLADQRSVGGDQSRSPGRATHGVESVVVDRQAEAGSGVVSSRGVQRLVAAVGERHQDLGRTVVGRSVPARARP